MNTCQVYYKNVKFIPVCTTVCININIYDSAVMHLVLLTLSHHQTEKKKMLTFIGILPALIAISF